MKKLALFILLLCSLCLNAQQRSESEAIQIAQEFFGDKSVSPKLSVVSHQKVASQVRKKVAAARRAQAKSQAFYVINDEANGRFVIVSADERLNTVLGYSDKGIFNAENAPEALLAFLEGYNWQYEYVVENGYNDQPRRVVRKAAKEIAPLLSSQWGQSSPFNDQCPENIGKGKGNLCVTGCVATAMAQIMYFHKYPQACSGSWQYYTGSQNIYQNLDFNTISFDWNAMLNTYDENSTSSQKSEVAKLMHACGVSVSMDYGDESGAYSPNIPYALQHYFGYNNNILYKERDYYSDEEWRGMIMSELEAGHPILYSGQGSGGHQFVLDGCDANGLFHFNFGWNGTDNGYFELDALKEPMDETKEWLYNLLGVSPWDYSFSQTMVYNITPESYGKNEDVFYSDKAFDISRSSVSVGSSSTFTLRAFCYDSNSTYQENKVSTFNGEIGVGLFDSNFQFIGSLYKTDVSNMGAAEGKGLLYKSITFSPDLFTSGLKYNIIPYAKEETSSEPTIIRVPYGKTAYYEANVTNGQVELTPKYEYKKEIIPSPILVGNYKATAYDKDNNLKEWIITLWQDTNDDSKYWMSNFDPEISDKGYSPEKGWNKVYGYADVTGTVIDIPVTDQYLAENIKLNNVTGNASISVSMSYANKTMSINDIWGAIETKSVSDGDASLTEISRYSNTRYSYTEGEVADVVNAPIINVSSNGQLTIISNTIGAEIYYTTDGATPSASSSRYTNPVELTGNCTVKAIAVKNNKESEVSQYEVTVFIVSKPTITAEGNSITIICATPGVTIYYALGEAMPSVNMTKYTGPFECNNSVVIKAIATKDGYKDSEIATFIHVPPVPPVPSDNVITIASVDAGQLHNHITEEAKMQITGLTISSGKLNGTDIKFIREMIVNGKLTDLNIANASIVSGGEAYYQSYTKEHTTQDNIIGEYMFYGCKGLLSIALPSSVIKIEGYAFNGCENIKQIHVPTACTTVEMFGIYNCKHLENVFLSSNVKDFHWANLSFCPNLTTISVDDGNADFISNDGVLFSKDMKMIVRYPMGKEGTSYIIPSSVTKIGQNAFSHSKLGSIIIPEGVTEIESSAFEYCNNLTGMVIPNTVTSMGMLTFSNCANLTIVTLSANLEEIKTLAFGYCVNIQRIFIPKSVKAINGTAFSGCASLKEFIVDDENPYFTSDNGVIYTKDMVELVKCPMALYAASYQIPDGVVKISDYAFNKCKDIEKFYLPESIEEIGSSAFEECTMSAIRVPQATSSLKMMAFENCDQLENFVIPEKVEELPLMLLAYCDNLSYVYIPAGVKKFGLSVFSSCKALSVINCRISNIDATEFAESYGGGYEQFKNIPDTCTWRIPIGCKERYQAQPWWVSTWRIIEANDPTPDGIDHISTSESLRIEVRNGRISLSSDRDMAIRIYEVDGVLKRTVALRHGETVHVDLPRGIYIIGGKKIVLK